MDSILDDVGVHLEWVVIDPESAWRDLEPVPLSGGFTRADATIRVQISDSLPEEWGLKREAMGIAVPGAPPRRRVVVFPLRILRVLAIDRGSGLPVRRRFHRAVGRAFARVIVHEVVHALAPDVSHAETGIMRGSLARWFLLADELALDEASREAVLAGLAERKRNRGTLDGMESPGSRTPAPSRVEEASVASGYGDYCPSRYSWTMKCVSPSEPTS